MSTEAEKREKRGLELRYCGCREADDDVGQGRGLPRSISSRYGPRP